VAAPRGVVLYENVVIVVEDDLVIGLPYDHLEGLRVVIRDTLTLVVGLKLTFLKGLEEVGDRLDRDLLRIALVLILFHGIDWVEKSDLGEFRLRGTEELSKTDLNAILDVRLSKKDALILEGLSCIMEHLNVVALVLFLISEEEDSHLLVLEHGLYVCLIEQNHQGEGRS
jgi:hypothetical protein